MKILLDSTILIDALRKDPTSTAEVALLVRSGHTLVISAINVGEVYSGMRPHELVLAEILLREMHTYSVTADIALHAGEMRNAAARKGRTLQLDDMIVAATALKFGLRVITDNVKDFKDTGVTIYGAAEN